MSTRLTMKIEGLRELQKALRQMSDKAPKVIQSAHKEVASVVVAEAKRNSDSAELASRIRAFGTTRAAGVRFLGHKTKGQSKTTDALLQEFGGRAPLFGDRDRWYTVKAKKRGGYIVYPAIRATRDEVNRIYLDELQKAIDLFWND